jgi:polysaccharide deacetylase 2 family uncharacterized protein YibQ
MHFALIKKISLVILIIGALFLGFKALSPQPHSSTQSWLVRLIHPRKSTPKPHVHANDIEAAIIALLGELEVEPSAIERRNLPGNIHEIKALIPRGRPREWVLWHLGQASSLAPYRLSDSYCQGSNGRCIMTFTPLQQPAPTVRLNIAPSQRYFSETARMALLINEFDFAADETTVNFLSFEQPLTFSIHPTQETSEWTAKIANHYNKEIIILMPLEGNGPMATNYPFQLKVHFDEALIQKNIAAMVRCIPTFSGFAPYHGSRFLQDSRSTELLVQSIRAKKGYVLDMQTTRNSFIPQMARKHQLPFGSIDATIDPKADEAAIDSLFTLYSFRAHSTGDIIVSASPTAALIGALNARLHRFKEHGIRLVYVSELVKREQ